MAEIQQLINTTITATIPSNAIMNTTIATPITQTDLQQQQHQQQGFELPQNYSILINKLERLALGLDEAFNNLSLDRKEVEIAVTGVNSGVSASPNIIAPEDYLLNTVPISGGRMPPPYVPQRVHHGSLGMGSGADVEYSRVVSDIWIGVILTLLIVSVVFFICSCFLYHKFQQWKNSYRTNANEPVEICRRYPDFEAESLPSYTIVSGLPTYDDALEEFRKAGIILAPQMPVIKLFDNSGTTETKESHFDIDGNVITASNNNSNINNNTNASSALEDDNVSIGSTCTCGNVIATQQVSNNSSNAIMAAHNVASQIIELSPAQLAQLSQKRLSLQIAFNSPIPVRRSSRPRIDLYREVNRNNLLRSHRFANGAIGVAPTSSVDVVFPPIHRSSSTFSLTTNSNEQRYDRHHRGSLC